jgi:type I restriction enzyme M protein
MPSGRAGVIIPNGLLSGVKGAGRNLRKVLLDECDLQAVITMPAGVFKPYASVATAALIFGRQGPTKSVWFYEMGADGFSLNDTRVPVDESDIPDVLLKWPTREDGPKSFSINRTVLSQFDDELTAGRYREREHEPAVHDDPNDIIDSLLKTEQSLIERLERLRAKMSDL